MSCKVCSKTFTATRLWAKFSYFALHIGEANVQAKGDCLSATIAQAEHFCSYPTVKVDPYRPVVENDVQKGTVNLQSAPFGRCDGWLLKSCYSETFRLASRQKQKARSGHYFEYRAAIVFATYRIRMA